MKFRDIAIGQEFRWLWAVYIRIRDVTDSEGYTSNAVCIYGGNTYISVGDLILFSPRDEVGVSETVMYDRDTRCFGDLGVGEQFHHNGGEYVKISRIKDKINVVCLRGGVDHSTGESDVFIDILRVYASEILKSRITPKETSDEV